MKGLKSIIICSSLILLAGACRERYFPDLENATTSHLVIEGVLKANGTTSITLSRTTQLDTFFLRPEAGAQIVVEGKDNSTAMLSYFGSGNYTGNLNLAIGAEYRVRVRTNNGGEYLSDYILVRETPDIDSISWRLVNNGLQIFANTHDMDNDSRYYRWEFDETWELRSYYPPKYIYENESVRERVSPAEDVFVGWKYGSSTSILIGSSANLANDVIVGAPLATIPFNSEKPAVRYSMLLRQYTLDKNAYEFYQLMKRNTESLGTIFDAQPTEIRGNFTSINNPEEMVIGHVTASSMKEKRIFITPNQMGGWYYPQGCITWEIPNLKDSIIYYFGGGGLMPYDAIYSEVNPQLIAKYKAAEPPCVDVTKRGASLIKPSYW